VLKALALILYFKMIEVIHFTQDQLSIPYFISTRLTEIVVGLKYTALICVKVRMKISEDVIITKIKYLTLDVKI
jgi:hypothetical protein